MLVVPRGDGFVVLNAFARLGLVVAAVCFVLIYGWFWVRVCGGFVLALVLVSMAYRFFLFWRCVLVELCVNCIKFAYKLAVFGYLFAYTSCEKGDAGWPSI